MATERPSKERTVIRPSTELKRAMDEADKCMAFINENEFIDYFQSLNEAYLENRGNIKGPEVAIGTRLDDKQKESKKLETGSTYGGAGVGLEWEDILEGRKYK